MIIYVHICMWRWFSIFPRGISRLGVSFRGCISVKHVFLRDDDQGNYISYEHVTSPKKLTCPLKRDPLKRKVAFQPSFCRGCDSFRGCICVYDVSKASNPSLKHWMEVQIFDKKRPTKGVSPNDGKPYRHTHVVCFNWSKERGKHPGSE